MGSWDGTLPAALPSGFVPTGSEWEAIRDAVASLTDPWNTYTPVWTASVSAPSIGNGSLSGTYFRSGKTGLFRASLLMGSTTGFGSGTYSIGLPPGWTGANSGEVAAGVVGMRDASANIHNTGFALIPANGTAISIRVQGANAATNAVPWTWTTSDFMYIAGILELA
jgi:hypothetical protein